jgi:hypothetical protein
MRHLSAHLVTALVLTCGHICVAHAQTRKAPMPVAEYTSEINGDATTSPTRYRQPGRPPIAELPPGVEELPVNTHWWLGLSALPVERSDAVVVGEITDAQAHLSSDKTSIFSEFTIQLEDVLKGNRAEITAGEPLVVERPGGGVRFPSGKIQYYRLARQGTPRVKTRYVLFLKAHAGARFSILTGYALHEGRVIPLDGTDNIDNRAQLPFAVYQNVEADSFLSDLRAALGKPPLPIQSRYTKH